MSRTEAHAPWWTRAPWLEPVHSFYCRDYIRHAWAGQPVTRPCNLPTVAARSANRVPKRTYDQCMWEPVWPGYRQMHKIYGCRVPRWYVEHVGHNVERVRERDKLGEMVKEFNATGGIDDGDFPCWQSRHSAAWGWD